MCKSRIYRKQCETKGNSHDLMHILNLTCYVIYSQEYDRFTETIESPKYDDRYPISLSSKTCVPLREEVLTEQRNSEHKYWIRGDLNRQFGCVIFCEGYQKTYCPICNHKDPRFPWVVTMCFTVSSHFILDYMKLKRICLQIRLYSIDNVWYALNLWFAVV